MPAPPPGGWAAAWPLPAAEPLRDRLLAAYGDPARGYHDLVHLGEVLTRLAELSAAGEPFEEGAVRLAAWFHDAVHDGGDDDEERSARWAEEALPAAGVAPPAVVEVARLVRLTQEHRPSDDDRNGAALSDADLAILAAPPERYAAYVAGVRREYATLDDAAFRRGRRAVLAALAAKPTLFHTGHARRAWEADARRNLARELAALDGPG